MSTLNLTLFRDHVQTPIGEMVLLSDEEGRVRVADWTDYESRMLDLLRRQYGASDFTLVQGGHRQPLTSAVERYFAGDLLALDDLPVAMEGTAFQRAVWSKLREIPCGTSISYAELAQRIGNPKAVRAVGLANGANPVGVIVPCHRVVGAKGSLTGYGGGLERKRWLLQHEAAQLTLTSTGDV